MKEYQRQFIELAISKQVIQFGSFTLKSGRKSPYFFNSGLFDSGADLALIGHCYAAALMDAELSFDQLFGPAYKGIPLVVTTAIALAQHYQHDVPYCFNRKEIKAHGEGGCLIGRPPTGRVVLIDDVITAGTAIRESMPLIAAGGATLAGVVIALDRQERGSDDPFALSALQTLAQQSSCRIISIITLTDLIEYLSIQPSLAGPLNLIRDYRQRCGISPISHAD